MTVLVGVESVDDFVVEILAVVELVGIAFKFGALNDARALKNGKFKVGIVADELVNTLNAPEGGERVLRNERNEVDICLVSWGGSSDDVVAFKRFRTSVKLSKNAFCMSC